MAILKPLIRSLQRDVVPGVVNALVAFPLSIGLAVIAGVAPEHMVLASIYSYALGALLSASRYGVGGPNTAVALMTGAAIAPFAPPESSLALGYVWALCVMVGAFQLSMAVVLRYVDIMDYVPTSIIDGLTVGIGAIFVMSSLPSALGLAPDGGNQWIVFNAYVFSVLAVEGDANGYAIIVAASTLLFGGALLYSARWKRYAIVVGVTVGVIAHHALELASHTRIETVGWLDVSLLATSLPDFRSVSWSTLFHLAGPAFAIAFMGTLQTLSIAKGIRHGCDPYSPACEAGSQGVQNVFMGFFAGAPVSNSYNKSALMKGSRGTRLSLMYAALFTILATTAGATIVAAIPIPALSAGLMLVGFQMMAPGKMAPNWRAGGLRRWGMLGAAAAAVVLSLQDAIIYGAAISAMHHFQRFSNLRLDIARRGDTLTINVEGLLFYSSSAKLQKRVQPITVKYAAAGGKRVVLDVTRATIHRGEALDLDWIHDLIGRSVQVEVVCTAQQRAVLEAVAPAALASVIFVAKMESEAVPAAA